MARARRVWLLAVSLSVLPVHATAQPDAHMLEVGIVGGNGAACPGQYVGITGCVAGPVSLYGTMETYRCVDLAGSASRLGSSLRHGRSRWTVRPALRAGIEYDGGDVSHTVGVSLTLGWRYGARILVDRGVLQGGGSIVLVHMGGYLSL